MGTLSEATLHPELQQVKSELDRAIDGVRVLTASLGDAHLNWRTDPTRWSIGQHVQHLSIVAQLYEPHIARAIAKARAAGTLSDGPYSHGWIGRKFIQLAEPPPRRRFPAPKSMHPPSTTDARILLPEFNHAHDRIVALIAASTGLDLGRVTVRTPVSALLRLSLGQAFALLAAHARRHIWHGWQIRNHGDFPDA